MYGFNAKRVVRCRDDYPGNTHLDAVGTAAVSFEQEFNGENKANSESFE